MLHSGVQFSRSVMSDSLWPHGLQYARLPCPSPTPGAYSNSCPSSRWCLLGMQWKQGRHFSQRCDFTSTIDTVFKYKKLKPYWIFKGLMRRTSNLDWINGLNGESEWPFALNISFPLVYQDAQNSFHQHSPVGISFDDIQKLLETLVSSCQEQEKCCIIYKSIPLKIFTWLKDSVRTVRSCFQKKAWSLRSKLGIRTHQNHFTLRQHLLI